ncbi:hypothetical protein ACLB4W_003371 [Vibrio cholerae]|uniref:hypothetical protein n=1 Tax=Vibrio cholerae TaxID=666 RepID=UPI001D306184|nr:hypothetical protein [Vibrio cholerae]EGR0795315.1 hypothetical protein [Vibrio cholerae]EGR0808892.1 hypothetical protein [Vibrio cholerae]EGR0812790.1 hypothetical protein [Vibrio cholerae]EJE4214343.1 hypothetical protein [Vibrio cholerae]ELM0317316.1 hypothetical protein [Vibrio cholerae]
MITEILKFIALCIPVLGAIRFFRDLDEYKVKKNKDRYEIYKRLKELVDDSLTKNYPEILVLISCMTSRKLSPSEIEWFVKQPGAFHYIGDYGVGGCKYLRLDIDNNKFLFTDKVDSLKKRIAERFKVFGFVFFLLCILLLLLSVLLTISSDSSLKMVYYFASLLIIIFALIAVASSFRSLDKAWELNDVTVGNYS